MEKTIREILLENHSQKIAMIVSCTDSSGVTKIKEKIIGRLILSMSLKKRGSGQYGLIEDTKYYKLAILIRDCSLKAEMFHRLEQITTLDNRTKKKIKEGIELHGGKIFGIQWKFRFDVDKPSFELPDPKGIATNKITPTSSPNNKPTTEENEKLSLEERIELIEKALEGMQDLYITSRKELLEIKDNLRVHIHDDTGKVRVFIEKKL